MDLRKPPATDIDFVNLVMTIGTSAAVALGDGPNPITKKVTIDLAKARNAINMLNALKQRTAGNLGAEESRLVTELLADLEAKYVESLDLDEAVLTRLRGKRSAAPEKVRNVQDWMQLIRRKQREHDENP